MVAVYSYILSVVNIDIYISISVFHVAICNWKYFPSKCLSSGIFMQRRQLKRDGVSSVGCEKYSNTGEQVEE